MAYEYPILSASFLASADMSAHQYKPVLLTTAGRINVCGSTITGYLSHMLGVLQDKSTAAGIECKVMLEGVTKVLVGSSSGLENPIVPGAYLATTGGGVKASSAAANQNIIGMALTAATTFGASTTVPQPYIAMLILRSGAVST